MNILGRRREKRKKKDRFFTPVFTVLIIAVIAIIIIYAVTNNASTITFQGITLTVGTLSDYEQKIVDYFNIESADLTLLYDSSISVESSDITGLNLKLSLMYSGSGEYWLAEYADGGIEMTYKNSLDSGAASGYTLSDLCTYLTQAHSKIRSTTYTVTFFASLQNSAEYGTNTYIWNGEDFDVLSATQEVDCYKISVSAASEYILYVV